MKKIFVLLVICLFSIIIIPNSLLAQESDPESQIIADVNFIDQKITSQEDHSLRISVTLKNMIGTQSGILYGLKAYRDVDGEQFLVDQFVPFDPIVLSQNETVTKEFEYTLPRVLGGDFSLFVFAETERGIPLALASLGSISLTGIKPSVDLEGCTFSTDNKTIDCVVKNTSDAAAKVLISTKVLQGNSVVGPTIFTIPAKIIELKPGEKKTESSELNMEVPPVGLFIETSLFDVDSAYPNEKFNFAIPAWEIVPKISNLLIEQKNSMEYLVKVITLEEQKDISTTVSLVGESGECAAQAVPLSGRVTEVLFSLDSYCQTVAIKADLLNKTGVVVDSLSVPHLSLFSGSSKNQSDKYVVAVTALAFLILILFALRRARIRSSLNIINIIVVGLFLLSANNVDAATILGTRTYTNSTINPVGSVTVHFALTYPSQLAVNATGFLSITDLSTSPGGIAQAGLARNSTPPPTGVPLNIGPNNWTQTGQTPFSHINAGTFQLSFSPYLISPNPSTGWTSNNTNPFSGTIQITETGGGSTGSGGPLYNIAASPIVCENGKAKTNISWIVPNIMPGEVTMNGQPFGASYIGGGSKWTTTSGDVDGEGLLTPGATYTFMLYSAGVYTNYSISVTATCGTGGPTLPVWYYSYRCDTPNSGNSCSFHVNQPCGQNEAGCFSSSNPASQCANYCGSQRYTCAGGCVPCGQPGQLECGGSGGSYTSLNQCRTICEQGNDISCGYIADPGNGTVGDTVDLELTSQYPGGGPAGTIGGSGAYYNPNVEQCIYNTIPNADGGNSTGGGIGFWSGISDPLVLGVNAFNARCLFSYTDNTGVPADSPVQVSCLSNGATGGAPGYRCSSSCTAGPACTSSDSDCHSSVATCSTACAVPVAPTATISPLGCTIQSGESTCPSTVSWTTDNITSPSIKQNNTPFATQTSGQNIPTTLSYGVNTFSVFVNVASSTPLVTATANAVCAGGSTWNNSVCAADAQPKLIICPATNPVIVSIGAPTSLQALYWASFNGTPTCSSGGSNVSNDASWSTVTNPSVASVDDGSANGGRVTGLIAGSATIRASYSVLYADKNVQVTAGVVYPEPIITIVSDPSIVRSGQTADVEITIEADYNLTCTLSGALTGAPDIEHNGLVDTVQDYTRTTVQLTAARVARVTCPVNGVEYSKDITISVIPTFQEI